MAWDGNNEKRKKVKTPRLAHTFSLNRFCSVLVLFREFFAKGANVQLGPGVCLARGASGTRSAANLSGPFVHLLTTAIFSMMTVPRNGRNFEYLSGE